MPKLKSCFQYAKDGPLQNNVDIDVIHLDRTVGPVPRVVFNFAELEHLETSTTSGTSRTKVSIRALEKAAKNGLKAGALSIYPKARTRQSPATLGFEKPATMCPLIMGKLSSRGVVRDTLESFPRPRIRFQGRCRTAKTFPPNRAQVSRVQSAECTFCGTFFGYRCCPKLDAIPGTTFPP